MTYLYKFLLFFSCVLCFITKATSQNKVIDSLKLELQKDTTHDTTKVFILNSIAFKYYGIDNNKLKEYTDKANALAKDIKYKRGEARSLYMNCVYNLSRNDFEKALDEINKSLKIYKEINDLAGISTCLDLIGTISQYQNNYEAAITSYQEALDIAKKQGSLVKISDYTNNIGGLFLKKGDYDTALKYFNESLAIDDSLKRKKSYITLNNIAIIHTKQGRYLEALENFQKCLHDFRTKNNKKGIATTSMNIGVIYESIEEYKKAIPYYLETLELNSELGDKQEVAKGYGNLGNAYKALDNYDKALQYYNNALEISETLNDTSGIAAIYANLASLYTKQKKYNLALTYLKKELELNLSLEKKGTFASTYVNLGNTYYNLKNYEKAFEYAEKGKKFADELQQQPTQKRVSLLLSKLYEQKNNFKDALTKFKEFKILSDSLFNKKSIQKLTALEYEYKYKQQLDSASLRELRLTKTVKTTSQNLKKSQRNLLLGIIAFLAIALIMGTFIFLYKLRHEKSKTQNIIIEQKLLRSQMTPHFIFNSLSVLQGMILNKEEQNSVSYLATFSKLLRTILENSRHKAVLLSEELAVLNDYVTLQNVDLIPPIQYELEVAPTIDATKIKIPPMLIQPFIENAIEHAFINKQTDKRICVSLRFLGELLICKITDNGVGIASTQKNKKGTNALATTITSERLKMLSNDFKKQGKITVQDRTKFGAQGTLVTLIIPYKTETLS